MDSRVRKTPGLPADVLGAVKAQDRLAVLHGLLDTAPDPDFDRITALAATVLQAPIALITLVDAERQWFKSSLGLDETETTAGMPFSAHAI
ncbi:MAG: histidine kinase, partial [Mesorhizobium sp.]